MHVLILTIVGLALFAAFLNAGSDYTRKERFIAKEFSYLLTNGVQEYASGVALYNLTFGKLPTSTEQFVPALIDPPKFPANVGASELNMYTVSGVGERIGICFSVSNATELQYDAVKAVQSDVGSEKIKVVNGCDDLTEINKPNSYPASFEFIYLERG